VASNGSDSSPNNQFRHHNGGHYNNHGQNNSGSGQNTQFSPDLSEALRIQEQRLEQALRLHHGSDLSGLHQQHHQQP